MKTITERLSDPRADSKARWLHIAIRTAFLATLVVLGIAEAVRADPAPFDLAGPDLEVHVTRGERTLPIAEVPNLAPGDRVLIRAALPATQSAHYVMVVAFLRGSTNPPPPEWFYRCDTWTHACADRGLTLVVPPGAGQVLVFLAPQTGGDFRTLVSAVRGRPGAFVRASQDLNQAMLDRSRLEAYLLAVHALDASDRSRLKDVAPLLARSLAIKVDEKCLDRIPQLQAPCLMQGRDALILNDGHSTSIVEALTSGPAADLAMEASYTPQLSYGYYSPYIASVLDIARILDSIGSAQYQYIPALASAHAQRLALTLNTPPSFHNPKSVLVAALPAVEPPQLPPLHAVDPKGIYCARQTALVLPVEGAPLAFSTSFVHEARLRLTGTGGKVLDLPAKPDAEQGGFVVDTSGLGGSALGGTLHGSLHGYWGFEEYDGPVFRLVAAPSSTWERTPSDDAPLIAGREDTLRLRASSAACLRDLMVKDGSGESARPKWKTTGADEVEVTLPLQSAKPGPLTLMVAQYGADEPQPVELQVFADVSRLEGFALHAGDLAGTLRGTRLDQVARLQLKGLEFLPEKLTSGKSGDELAMVAPNAGSSAPLRSGDSVRTTITLKDGRTLSLDTVILAPRPRVVVIEKRIEHASSTSASHIHLVDQRELPQDARLTFAIRAIAPTALSRDDTIEIASSDQAFSTTLGLGRGVVLENSHVAVATLDPASAFGASAFGPLLFRVIAGGVAGDWQPLVTLVRLPELTALECPATPELACRLSGSNLFLVDAISADAEFRHPMPVPDGFPGPSLPVPHPSGEQLYLRLRDDPAVINAVALPAGTLPRSPEEAARAEVRQASTLAENNSDATAGEPQPGGDPPPAPAADPGHPSPIGMP